MKRFFTRLLSTVLAVALVIAVRAGVTTVVDKVFEANSVKKLTGTYQMEDMLSADTAEEILTTNDFYAEEIALAELNSLSVPKFVEYHSDKTYTYYYDANGYRDNVEAFFRETFDRMYEGRVSLSSLYNADFTSMSKADFQAYYASLYSENSFDDLIATLANGCWDYEALSNDVEIGTYSIQDNKIIYTEQGSTLKEHVTYKLSGNSLSLTYSDGVENYTKIA